MGFRCPRRDQDREAPSLHSARDQERQHAIGLVFFWSRGRNLNPWSTRKLTLRVSLLSRSSLASAGFLTRVEDPERAERLWMRQRDLSLAGCCTMCIKCRVHIGKSGSARKIKMMRAKAAKKKRRREEKKKRRKEKEKKEQEKENKNKNKNKNKQSGTSLGISADSDSDSDSGSDSDSDDGKSEGKTVCQGHSVYTGWPKPRTILSGSIVRNYTAIAKACGEEASFVHMKEGSACRPTKPITAIKARCTKDRARPEVVGIEITGDEAYTRKQKLRSLKALFAEKAAKDAGKDARARRRRSDISAAKMARREMFKVEKKKRAEEAAEAAAWEKKRKENSKKRRERKKKNNKAVLDAMAAFGDYDGDDEDDDELMVG